MKFSKTEEEWGKRLSRCKQGLGIEGMVGELWRTRDSLGEFLHTFTCSVLLLFSFALIPLGPVIDKIKPYLKFVVIVLAALLVSVTYYIIGS